MAGSRPACVGGAFGSEASKDQASGWSAHARWSGRTSFHGTLGSKYASGCDTVKENPRFVSNVII